MKHWLKRLLHGEFRKLEFSVGGKWYLAFTIVLGVVAVYSANNVIYLLESLLLSTLLFSGVLSEQTVTRLKVERHLSQAWEQLPTDDLLVVKNNAPFPLFCVSVGEWKENTFYRLAFFPMIPRKAELRVRSRQVVAERGIYSWEKFAVVTSFPFGIAKKIRFFGSAGKRIVWPRAAGLGAKQLDPRNGPELSVGEVEEIPEWGDISRVHWPSSARAQSLLGLPRKSSETEEAIDLCPPGEELERRIRAAAQGLIVYRGDLVNLVLRNGKSSHIISGRKRALDSLALLPKEST